MLVMTLIILVVLSVIAVVSAKSSVLQVIMSANTQFQVESLAEAEVTIRAGERDIDTIVSDSSALVFETSTDHYFLPGGTHQYMSLNEGNYAVEYAGPRRVAGESQEIGTATAGTFVYVFIVHAQNESSKSAWREVDTVYVTATAP